MRFGIWNVVLLLGLGLIGVSAYRGVRTDVVLREGRRAYESDDYARAAEAFARARAAEPDDPSIWAWQGDTAEALARRMPDDRWTVDRADALTRDAWTGYAGAVLRSPLDTWSWCGLAETALRRAEDVDRARGVDLDVLERRGAGVLDVWRAIALASAKTALTLKPSGFQELDALSRVFRASGQLDAARDAMVRSARMMPSPSLHDWGQGEAFAAPLYPALLAATLEGVSRAPGFERSALHLDIGRFALRQDDLKIALEQMRLAETTSMDAEGLYQARRGTAQVLERAERYDDAIRVWDEVVASGLAAPVDRRQRGILLRRVNRNADACIDLKDAVQANPADQSLRLFASSTCEAGSDLTTAEQLLRDGFVTPLESMPLSRALIDFCLRNGKRSTAEGLLRTWVRDFPERDEFSRWLGEIGPR